MFAHADVLPKLSALGGAVTAVAPGESFGAAGLQVRVYGGRHAVIHPDIPRIANLGYLISDGSTSVYHPGDSFEVPDERGGHAVRAGQRAVARSSASRIEFVRAVKPRRAFALHDALLNETGAQDHGHPPGQPCRLRLRPARPGHRDRTDVPDESRSEQLYAAPPDGFVAARAAAVAAARQAGDRDTAKRLGALKKPTVAAWLVNLLALRRPELLDELVELAAALRSAQRNLQGRPAARVVHRSAAGPCPRWSPRPAGSPSRPTRRSAPASCRWPRWRPP